MNFTDRDITRLGGDGPSLPRLGFGCCPMGGHGWGVTDDAELLAAVSLALDEGIVLFDTADIYGLGRSEELLARGLNSRRKDALIATKGGVRRTEGGKTYYDNSAAHLRNALEGSLRRLRTDYIDLYQLHYWDGMIPVCEVLETFAKFQEEGKIIHYGVTNINVVPCNDLACEKLSSFSFELSLAQRSHEAEILANMHPKRTFISWGTLGQGILTGKYDRSSKFLDSDRRSRAEYSNFHGERRARNIGIVEAMRTSVSERLPGHVAIRWVLDRFDGSVALVGIKRPEQLRQHLGSMGWELTPEELTLLNRISDDTEIS